MGEIGGSLSHTFRTRDTPNADPLKLRDNEHQGPASAEGVLSAIKERLPAKRRSDAVLCIEYFIGASPEFFSNGGNEAAYFATARDWLVERHGGENVISTHVHRDETSPHLIAYIVPRDGDKLNAKKWLGGRAVLSAMQTDFAQSVGLSQGLERGEEGSAAKHQTIKEYYAQVRAAEREMPTIVVPTDRLVERKIFTRIEESDSDFAKRAVDAALAQVDPLIKRGVEYGQIAKRERAQAKQVSMLTKALRAANERIRSLEAPFQGLVPEDVDRLTQMLNATARKMREAALAVTGWFRGIVQERPGEEHLVEVEEKGTGKIHKIPSTRAALDLAREGVEPGDLVSVSVQAGKVISRRLGLGR